MSYDAMIALGRSADYFDVHKAFVQKVRDDIAALTAGGLTNTLVYGARKLTSAVDVALVCGDSQVQALTLSAAGKAVSMPAANASMVEGEPWTIHNAGTHAFSIKDNAAGVLLAALAAGETVILFLLDDGTAAGEWLVKSLGADVPDAADQLARNMAAAAMALANANDVAGPKGPFYLADPFTADSLATKTDATYDATNDLYYNPGAFSSDQIPDMTGNTTPSGTASASDETGGLASSAMTDDISAGNAWQANAATGWIAYEFTAAKTITRYTLQAMASFASFPANGYPKSWTFDGYNGSGWDVLDTQANVAVWSTSEKRTYDISSPASYSKYRLNISANQGDPSWTHLGELEMMTGGTSLDMTLEPTAGVLDTANPTDLMGYFLIEPVDALTMGTDVIGKLSIDGGTTLATGTWTKVGPFGAGTVELWRLDADVSAQTGTSVCWQITTANAKGMKLHSCVGVIPIY